MTVLQGWVVVVLLLAVVVLLAVLIGVLLGRYVAEPVEVVAPPDPGSEREAPRRPPVARAQPRRQRARTVDVIGGVVEFFAVTISDKDLTGPSRQMHVVTARHITMRLARELTDDTYAQVGAALNRDHATVIYGCEQAASMAVEDVRETVLARWELAGIVPSRSTR